MYYTVVFNTLGLVLGHLDRVPVVLLGRPLGAAIFVESLLLSSLCDLRCPPCLNPSLGVHWGFIYGGGQFGSLPFFVLTYNYVKFG